MNFFTSYLGKQTACKPCGFHPLNIYFVTRDSLTLLNGLRCRVRNNSILLLNLAEPGSVTMETCSKKSNGDYSFN